MNIKPNEIREYAQAIKAHAPRGHRTAQEVTDALADMTLQLLDEREKLLEALREVLAILDERKDGATRPPARLSTGRFSLSRRCAELVPQTGNKPHKERTDTMQRITSKTLHNMIGILNKVAGTNPEPYSKDAQGKFKANIGAFLLDSSNPGDGRRYQICRICNESGGQSQPFGSRSYSAQECYLVLSALIDAIDACKHGRI